ncbi:MAG: hypothetical protein U0800_26760 [Isosphaeraceae bacterium]
MLPLLAMTPAFLAADDPSDRRIAEQTALKPLGELVGAWRGVGMVQRNQQKGAWKETADWSWILSEGSAALQLRLSDGKYLKSAVIRPGQANGEFRLDAVLSNDAARSFIGKMNDRKQLVMESEEKPNDTPARLTITPLHENRFLILLEAAEGPKNFRRLGEVGYTREGVAFAAGDGGPLCIVTGGRGTMAIKFRGETYYVCCSGCKQLFDANPEAVIAQAKGRKP